MKSLVTTIIALVSFVGILQAHSEVRAGLVVVFGNEINGTSPGTANPFVDGQIFDPNVTVSGIGRVGLNGANPANRYTATGWSSGNLDLGQYFTFTITPNDGFFVNYENFTYSGQRTGNGPTSFAFRSSVDNFTTNIGSPLANGATIALTADAFQGVTNATEFRLYGWGGSGQFSVNDFSFNGAVSAVPEPTSVLLVASALAVFTLRRRRS
jgi:hypothetical protein